MIRALAVADLETRGEYREAVHDILFEDLGANGLDAAQLADLPDYLVCTDAHSLDAAEAASIIELFAAGLPVKVMVRTDDVLEPSTVAEGHLVLGSHAAARRRCDRPDRRVRVSGEAASHLFQSRDSLLQGLSFGGPGLFSIYSGAGLHTSEVPAYLAAAAAMASRAFPALVYDPSAGPDRPTRLSAGDNLSPGDDWPVQALGWEDEALQAHSEELAFTFADFAAMDDRFSGHFALVPPDEWTDEMIPIPEALASDDRGIPETVPYISVVDDEGRLSRAIVDNRIILDTRRCLAMWHSLQANGAADIPQPAEPLAETEPAAADAPEPAAAVTAVLPDEASANGHSDEPYIETPRCTTCNECTNLNNRMFAYDENKQAYIADPDAGTFRQLVEAAEGCQVSIIHPGKPRNPKEPGLEDLIKRAADFN